MTVSEAAHTLVLSSGDYTVAAGAGTTQSALTWRWHVLAFVAAAGLVVSRRPDAIVHAQFFAEDGHVWFADAYNRGWFTSLFRTQDGYFQTLPRLAAALSLLVPLSWAALVINLIGLIIQILPVPLLLSRRLSRLGSLQLRAALAFVYICLLYTSPSPRDRTRSRMPSSA